LTTQVKYLEQQLEFEKSEKDKLKEEMVKYPRLVHDPRTPSRFGQLVSSWWSPRNERYAKVETGEIPDMRPINELSGSPVSAAQKLKRSPRSDEEEGKEFSSDDHESAQEVSDMRVQMEEDIVALKQQMKNLQMGLVTKHEQTQVLEQQVTELTSKLNSRSELYEKDRQIEELTKEKEALITNMNRVVEQLSLLCNHVDDGDSTIFSTNLRSDQESHVPTSSPTLMVADLARHHSTEVQSFVY